MTTSTHSYGHKMSDCYQHKERKRRSLERKVSARSSGMGEGGVQMGEERQTQDEGTTDRRKKPQVMK